MALQLAWLHDIICQQICAYDTLGQRFSICPSHRKAKLKIANVILSCFTFLTSSQLLSVRVMNLSIYFPKSVPLLITDVLKRVCTDSCIKGRLINSANPHRQENAEEEERIFFFFSSRAGFLPSRAGFFHVYSTWKVKRNKIHSVPK